MSSDGGRARALRDLGLGDGDLAAWHAAALPEERFETPLAMSAVFFFFAEPIAAHGHFYDDGELVRLAKNAGLREVAVANEDGGQLLTALT
jgi:hypothetical protein